MWIVGLAEGLLFRRAFGRLSPELPPGELLRITGEFAVDAKAKRSTLRLFRQMLGPEFFAGVDDARRTLLSRVPVRVVWGSPDPYIPERYVSSFAGTTVELVAGAGHWVPITAATQVAAAVRAVLAAAEG